MTLDSSRINTEIESAENAESFTQIASRAIKYLFENAIPEALSPKVRAKILKQPNIVIKSLSAIGKVRIKNTDNLGNSSNEVIASQEGLLGFTPHNQRFDFNRMHFSKSLADSGLNIPSGIISEKERVLKASPEKSRYLALEPVTLRSINSLVLKYQGAPDRTLRFSQKEGVDTVEISGEKKLSLDNAVRLVIPTTDGRGMEFINLTYDQFLNIASLVPMVDDIGLNIPYPPMISEIIHNGLSKSKESYLKRHGVEIIRYPLDDWYSQDAAIVTVSNNDFFVYDQRGAIQVNLGIEIDPHLNQYELTSIDTQAVHLAATAVPVTSWLIDEILPLGNLEKETNLSDTQGQQALDKITTLPVRPSRFTTNPSLPEYCPILASQQQALILAKYGDEGARMLSKITNIHEVIVRKKLPTGIVEIAKNNNDLLSLVQELDESLIAKNSKISFTTYLMLAAAMLDKRSSMLSVNPDPTNSKPNSLELALLCNGVNQSSNELVGSIIKIFTQADFSLNNLVPSLSLNEQSSVAFHELLTYNRAYSEEVARASLGRGTPGILARLTGSLRDALETISRQLASPAMAQLEPNTQVSSLGNMDKKFNGKVKLWGFNSSNSRSIIEWDALNSDILSIGQKVFTNPINTILSLDKHCDPKLFDGLIRTYSKQPELDKYDKILLGWMIGRRNQELMTKDIDAQQTSYNSIFRELYKDIITRRLEKSKNKLHTEFKLAKKLQHLKSYPPYSQDFNNLPIIERDELNSLFNQLAVDSDQPIEYIIGSWSERINSLPNGVHDLFTNKDSIWTKYLESIKNIDVLEPGNSLAPSIREQIEKSASDLSLDVNTSNVLYNDNLAFTSLSSFYEQAGNDAELLVAMKEISDRFSYSLTEYLSSNPDNSEQIQNLKRAINLNVWKKSHDTINTASAIALAVHTHLVNLIVHKIYVDQDNTVEPANPMNRTRSFESEQKIIALLVNQVSNFEMTNITTLKQLCTLAKTHNISQESIVNFLILSNNNHHNLAKYLSTSLNPEIADAIEDEIDKSVMSLTV